MTAIACWLVAAPALAQQPGTSATASAKPPLEACVLVEIAVDRLACYDAAMAQQQATSTQAADKAAQQAKQTKQAIDETQRKQRSTLPLGEQAQRIVSDLFRSEPGSEALDRDIANAGKGSLLDSRWELARDSKLGVFNFRAYKPVYLLPAFWSSNTNELPHSPNPRNTATVPLSLTDIEAKFQISFKTKAVENLFGDNGDIWMGYTQSSRWQVYNDQVSRPFRESNYEPEVLLVFRNNYSIGGWHGRLLGVGINHQSNGRADPLSRSWNRVMFNIGLDRENWAVMLRPWWRISDGNDDDNPDIADYMGRGDLTLVHVRDDGQQFSLMLRHSLRGGDNSHGAVQFDWGFPISRTLRGHLQVFDGYGESLIDYNHRATYIGLGISLLEWY